MKNMELYEAVNQIDERLIDEAKALSSPKVNRIRWASAVAAVLIVPIACMIFYTGRKLPYEPVDPDKPNRTTQVIGASNVTAVNGGNNAGNQDNADNVTTTSVTPEPAGSTVTTTEPQVNTTVSADTANTTVSHRPTESTGTTAPQTPVSTTQTIITTHPVTENPTVPPPTDSPTTTPNELLGVPSPGTDKKFQIKPFPANNISLSGNTTHIQGVDCDMIISTTTNEPAAYNNGKRYVQVALSDYSSFGLSTTVYESSLSSYIGNVIFPFGVTAEDTGNCFYTINSSLVNAKVYDFGTVGGKKAYLIKNDTYCSIFVKS